MNDDFSRGRANAALQVTGVSKAYGKLEALAQVSLRVMPGEFTALLGPNGAGKTTLFQILTGLFVADEGDVHISGDDIRSHAIRCLANLGVVFQQPTLDLDLSVRANLRFHARLQGLERTVAGRRIDDQLERLGIAAEADRACRQLSGGNRRKVELARALLHTPRILLMDEATVGLDPSSRRALLDYVHGLCNEHGQSVLWATHLVDEADSADTVLVLHKGRMVATGTPAELIARTGEPMLADAFLKLTDALEKK
jgi:ABC-2 type transport system ATP-binding protein